MFIRKVAPRHHVERCAGMGGHLLCYIIFSPDVSIVSSCKSERCVDVGPPGVKIQGISQIREMRAY